MTQKSRLLSCHQQIKFFPFFPSAFSRYKHKLGLHLHVKLVFTLNLYMYMALIIINALLLKLERTTPGILQKHHFCLIAWYLLFILTLTVFISSISSSSSSIISTRFFGPLRLTKSPMLLCDAVSRRFRLISRCEPFNYYAPRFTTIFWT